VVDDTKWTKEDDFEREKTAFLESPGDERSPETRKALARWAYLRKRWVDFDEVCGGGAIEAFKGCEYAAYHEAGHAVVGVLLEEPVSLVLIAGQTTSKDEQSSGARYVITGNDTPIDKLGVIAYAGPLSLARFLGGDLRNSFVKLTADDDLKAIAGWAEQVAKPGRDAEKAKSKWRREARLLLAEGKDKVDRLVDVLLELGSVADGGDPPNVRQAMDKGLQSIPPWL